uniref:Mediator of RNA polymerase II transcription subunit 31 n=1 Tax=Fundulus heteroclitus TaxID=8078 RepID=A0A3Q2QIG9_FUNHE
MLTGLMEEPEQARNRFQSELEFVQCLANPNYLNFLAQRGYLRDRPFINYLKYLKELVNAQCAKFIDEQQLLHWQHYSRKRTRLQQALAEQQQPPQQPPPHGNAAAK